MEVYFKYNIVVELLNSLLRYARNEEIEAGFLEMNYKKNEEISLWVSGCKNKTSKFMDSEITKIFRIPGFNYIMLIKEVTDKNINDVNSFLEYIQGMTEEEYIKGIYYSLEIQDESNISNIRDILLKNYNEELTCDALEMIENPHETISRIYFAVKRFYELLFIKIEETIRIILEKKVCEHKAIYQRASKEFIKNIIGLNEADFKRYEKVNFFVSHFKEAITTFFDTINDHLEVVYGWQLEYKFDTHVLSEKRKALFKVLSDEKRVEILKLISIRPWYGNELAQHLGITTATLSYHIGKLFNMDLITYEEGESNRLYYSLNKVRLEELFDSALKDIIG